MYIPCVLKMVFLLQKLQVWVCERQQGKAVVSGGMIAQIPIWDRASSVLGCRPELQHSKRHFRGTQTHTAPPSQRYKPRSLEFPTKKAWLTLFFLSRCDACITEARTLSLLGTFRTLA